MWNLILFGFFSAIYDVRCQEITGIDSQPVTQMPSVGHTFDWDTTGSAIRVNIENARPNAAPHETKKEKSDNTLLYSNQWRPVIMPMYYNPYGDSNLRSLESEDATDNTQESKHTFIKSTNSNLNKTVPLTSQSNAETRHPVFSDSVNHFPYPSSFAQDQFAPQTMHARPPVFYPNAVSINVQRSYTTNIKEVQNASDSNPSISVTEPVTSSFVERYTQVLPSSVPVLSNRFFPYGNFRNQPAFYPQPTPFYLRPYAIPPPGVGHPPPAQVSNASLQPFVTEASSEIPETEVVERQRPELERPIPYPNIESLVGDVPRVPPSFVAPNPLTNPTGIFPFVWPPPVFPPVLQNPMASRIIPPNPALIPDAVDIPREMPAVEVMSKPMLIETKPLLEPNPKLMPSDDTLEDTSVSENVETDFVDGKLKPSRIPYEFGFDMNDGKGTDQHRMEVSDASGVVTGSYGYRDMFGVYRLVNYIADKNGFRAFVKSNEPGVASSGSADVVVVAEPSPPHAVAEATKVTQPAIVILPEPEDLIAQGSEIETE